MPALSCKYPQQRGMAIISALLIAAVVAVIAGGMLTRQSIFTRALQAEQARLQGGGVLLGGLETGRQLLWEARQSDVLTRLDQPWAQPIGNAALTELGGAFEGRLEDQQGKFNLRNLLLNQQVDLGEVRNFERLCEMIGIDVTLSRRISQRVIASYVQLSDSSTASSTASNVPMPARQPMLRSLDDLRGIEGLSDASLARLQQYVGILPGNTWVNANTASAEVLAAVVPKLPLEQARALLKERDSGQWFINRGDFVNRVRVPQLSVDNLSVGISSEWFLLQGQARRDQRTVSLQALLHSPREQMPRVIWSRVGV